jgi:hypothetical protein
MVYILVPQQLGNYSYYCHNGSGGDELDNTIPYQTMYLERYEL